LIDCASPYIPPLPRPFSLHSRLSLFWLLSSGIDAVACTSG
jgi:hypothetical protein